MPSSTIANNMSGSVTTTYNSTSALPAGAQAAIARGAVANLDAGSTLQIAETVGSSKVTPSIQSLTLARLDSDGSSVEATVTKMSLAELSHSTLTPQQPSIFYTQQLAGAQQRAVSVESPSGIQENTSLSTSVLSVTESNHGASASQVNQFLAWVGAENNF
jgi:hypothetical protein